MCKRKGCKHKVKGVRKVDGVVYRQVHCVKCRRKKARKRSGCKRSGCKRKDS